MSTRQLPQWVPPNTASRIKSQGIASIRQLAIDIEAPEMRVRRLFTTHKQAVVDLLNILYVLGYDCDSPEFDVIKEICTENLLSESHTGDTLIESEVMTKQEKNSISFRNNKDIC